MKELRIVYDRSFRVYRLGAPTCYVYSLAHIYRFSGKFVHTSIILTITITL